jgi:hypothetical protein
VILLKAAGAVLAIESRSLSRDCDKGPLPEAYNAAADERETAWRALQEIAAAFAPARQEDRTPLLAAVRDVIDARLAADRRALDDDSNETALSNALAELRRVCG